MKYTALLIISVLYLSCRNEPEGYSFNSNITIYSVEPSKKTVVNTPPPDIPADMVYVPGGFTLIGSEEGVEWEKPTFWAQVRPFLMDAHEVTVGQFRKFIDATHYKTEAEKFGDAGILNEETKQWILAKGANWEYPFGKNKPKAADNYPVTQVSWNDASAYAKWAGKRLPYEIEWEHAARNGSNSRMDYPFGNEIVANGSYLANTWNGSFPEFDKTLDGFHYAAPVGSFAKSPLGLFDLSGNVWEWCEDWRTDYRTIIANKVDTVAEKKEKVQRGGSFLCEPSWCHGYRVSGRSFTSPETSLMHVGFRCVKDI
ncbi:formylglycine-generating enzyme family protein [Emticicia fluvialis]|uniref:formylglycine-generating enzyme family protein n=1 Tax=Emticicia fluvialis TaxID=2974474 RepID=UPI0021655E35|nr:formylglycine-generating enzyme family protein [Emticicia fluvialis]